jgi:hypothetical protein
MELQKLRKQKMAELLSMERRAIHGTVRSVTDCQYVQSFPSVIQMLTFLRLCLGLLLQLRATSTEFQAKILSCKTSEI